MGIAELETAFRQRVQQPVIKTTMHAPLDVQKESGGRRAFVTPSFSALIAHPD